MILKKEHGSIIVIKSRETIARWKTCTCHAALANLSR